jgi:beta-lactamase regulating signal transducer with metallopeptidase domain/protocatechuate 3,4-dioxygenase beta subunit
VNTIDVLVSHPAVHALGWTLIYFVWQGAFVAALLAGMLAALRNRSAHARYLVACMALLAMATLPPITLRAVAEHGRRTTNTTLRTPAVEPSRHPVRLRPTTPEHTPPPAAILEPRRVEHAPATVAVRLQPTWRQRATALLEPLLPWCVTGWATGVILLSAPLIGGWRHVQRLKRRATQPVLGDWQVRFARLTRQLQISRPVCLLESALTQVPIVIGWLRPVILLPASVITGLTPEQIEAVLAHELAHIRRHDYLVNLVQSVIETLLFYHPAVWWVSRRIRVERELCCDDWAVRVCGDALTYAHALAELEQQRATGLAPAATGGTLLGRIRRIVGVPVAPPPLSRGWVAGVVSLVAVVGVACALWLASGPAAAAALQDTLRYRPIPANAGPTPTITGVVTDQEGRPIAGAPVFAVQHSDEENPPQRTQRTDAGGRFTFEDLKPDGYWRFYVDDPRFGREWDRERVLHLPVDGADLPLRVRLYPPQLFTGTVVDEAGAPVPDVKVTLVREWLPGAAEQNPVQGWLAFDLQTTMTDRDGRFRLERLRPGEIVLMLEHPDFARTLSGILSVAAGEARVTIRKGLTLHGRVLADGKPLPKVAVKAGAPNASHRSMGEWKLVTDDAGEFEIRHIVNFLEPEGQFVATVTVSVDDPAWQSDWYGVYQLDEQTLPAVGIHAWAREGASREPTMIKLGAADEEKRGRAAGAARGVAKVEIRVAGGTTEASTSPRSVYLYGVDESIKDVYRMGDVGADGTLVFAGLRAGHYRIASDNYPGRDVELAEDQSVQVIMEKGAGRIRGLLRVGGEPVTGAAVAKASVRADVATGGSRGGFEQFTGSVAENGGYTINGVPPGPCALVVSLSRSGSHYYAVTATAGITHYDVDLPQGQMTVHLPASVIDAQNPPHLLVHQHDDAAFSDFASAWLAFDASGNCSVQNLAPGDYVLSVTIPGQIGPRLGTARLEGPTAHVEVELGAPEHTGWIAGALRNLPLPVGVLDSTGLMVAAVPKGDRGYDLAACHYGTANPANGTYRLTDLPAGTYALRLMGLSPTEVPVFWGPDVEVREGLVRELDLTIPPSRAVLIRLTYDGPQPPWAVWRLRFPNGAVEPSGGILGSHGTNIVAPVMAFRLPFGEYVLEADFGTDTPVVRAFIVEPGDAVQEIAVSRP